MIPQDAHNSYAEEKIKEAGIKVGHWVRFYHGGRLVIEEVRYVTYRTGGYVDVLTDAGPVESSHVLERR